MAGYCRHPTVILRRPRSMIFRREVCRMIAFLPVSLQNRKRRFWESTRRKHDMDGCEQRKPSGQTGPKERLYLVRMPVTRSEWVYEKLKEVILSGEMAPGERLVVDQLARELGTSPIPVREAVRRLEAEGWVENTPLSVPGSRRCGWKSWKSCSPFAWHWNRFWRVQR